MDAPSVHQNDAQKKASRPFWLQAGVALYLGAAFFGGGAGVMFARSEARSKVSAWLEDRGFMNPTAQLEAAIAPQSMELEPALSYDIPVVEQELTAEHIQEVEAANLIRARQLSATSTLDLSTLTLDNYLCKEAPVLYRPDVALRCVELRTEDYAATKLTAPLTLTSPKDKLPEDLQSLLSIRDTLRSHVNFWKNVAFGVRTRHATHRYKAIGTTMTWATKVLNVLYVADRDAPSRLIMRGGNVYRVPATADAAASRYGAEKDKAMLDGDNEQAINDAVLHVGAFAELLRAYPDKEWYIVVPDTAYPLVGQLRPILAAHNAEGKTMVGLCDERSIPTDAECAASSAAKSYVKDGSMVILSRAAAEALVASAETCLAASAGCTKGDARLAACLSSVGVTCASGPKQTDVALQMQEVEFSNFPSTETGNDAAYANVVGATPLQQQFMFLIEQRVNKGSTGTLPIRIDDYKPYWALINALKALPDRYTPPPTPKEDK